MEIASHGFFFFFCRNTVCCINTKMYVWKQQSLGISVNLYVLLSNPDEGKQSGNLFIRLNLRIKVSKSVFST